MQGLGQSSVIDGENYIVVNYQNNSYVKKIWVLWDAQDKFFSPKRPNSNARTVDMRTAVVNVEVIYAAER